MAKIKIDKVVSVLPNPLVPNTVYAVRVGNGFDLYISDSTGTTAHTLNSESGFLNIDNNLSDLADLAISRTNLDVYSKAESATEAQGTLADNSVQRNGDTMTGALKIRSSSFTPLTIDRNAAFGNVGLEFLDNNDVPFYFGVNTSTGEFGFLNSIDSFSNSLILLNAINGNIVATDFIGSGSNLTGVLKSLVAGTDITIDVTDPENPIINSTSSGNVRNTTQSSFTGDSVQQIVRCTQAEYDALTPPDPNTLYLTPEV